MERLACQYYCEGYGCGQCIIKAADEKYKLGLDENILKASGALGNGCGYGGICSVLSASIMIFGIMFDDVTVKRLRICLLEEFKQTFGSFNCCSLSAKYGCDSIIQFAASTADRLISQELGKV